jgi:beta-lactamase class A
MADCCPDGRLFESGDDFMTISLTRRSILAGSLLAAPALMVARTALADVKDAAAQLRALEKKYGGRLGVAILDTASGTRIEHRADERFALCSTFKVLASAAVLARVDKGEEKLDRRITYEKKDLVTYSPVTEKHVGKNGMTLAELCEAAITLSDNTAGNLLLASFGGPAGLTAYVRTLGDEVTRLDRIETALNEAKTGDPRDTTTPAAMLADLQKLVLGDALSPASRDQLKTWLLANKTGDKRLRAHLPKDWKVGDKTGTGDNGSANDVGILWPPKRGPIIVSSYFTESSASTDEKNTVHAEVGRIAATLV